MKIQITHDTARALASATWQGGHEPHSVGVGTRGTNIGEPPCWVFPIEGTDTNARVTSEGVVSFFSEGGPNSWAVTRAYCDPVY